MKFLNLKLYCAQSLEVLSESHASNLMLDGLRTVAALYFGNVSAGQWIDSLIGEGRGINDCRRGELRHVYACKLHSIECDRLSRLLLMNGGTIVKKVLSVLSSLRVARTTLTHAFDSLTFCLMGSTDLGVDGVASQLHVRPRPSGGEALEKPSYHWPRTCANRKRLGVQYLRKLLMQQQPRAKACSREERFLPVWGYLRVARLFSVCRKFHLTVQYTGLRIMMNAAQMDNRHRWRIVDLVQHRITTAATAVVNSMIQGIRRSHRGLLPFISLRVHVLFHLCGAQLQTP